VSRCSILRAGDDTEDEGDSAAVKKDRHAAAVAPAALRGISSDAKRATLQLTLPLAGTPLQARVTIPLLSGSKLLNSAACLLLGSMPLMARKSVQQ
jgi:hypothetical protein